MSWPTAPDGTPFTDKIKLDKTSRLDYLDHPDALPLRTTVRDVVHSANCKNIVDVGCGVGRMYDFLEVENYMGFDDDWRLINPGKRERPDADLRVASWRHLDKLEVDFDVDCVLFLGVLSYAMPDWPEVYEKNGDHIEMFHNIIDLYKPKKVIIQEILAEQTHVAETNELKVLPLEYYNQFKPKCTVLDLPIFCGHRIIMEIDTSNVFKKS